jgi:hypothetical protein
MERKLILMENYYQECWLKRSLVFSYIGLKTQEVNVEKAIACSIKEDSAELKRSCSIGCSVRKKDARKC